MEKYVVEFNFQGRTTNKVIEAKDEASALEMAKVMTNREVLGFINKIVKASTLA